MCVCVYLCASTLDVENAIRRIRRPKKVRCIECLRVIDGLYFKIEFYFHPKKIRLEMAVLRYTVAPNIA